MDQIMFSVCIAVRNTKKYITQCIDSVLNQIYKNYEIIIIDNESTDGSEIIIDSYKKKYKNIKVVHQKNQGLLMSRRKALSLTEGDYICFLDSDDYWDEKLLLKCSEEIRNTKCDIVSFSYTEVNNKGNIRHSSLYKEETILSNIEYARLVFENAILNNLWIKVINKHIFDREKDDEYKKYGILNRAEGGIQTIEIVENAKSIRVINSPLYYYRVQGQGATHFGELEYLSELEIQYSCFSNSQLCNSMKADYSYSKYQAQFLFNIFVIIVRIARSECNKTEKKNKLRTLSKNGFFLKLMKFEVLRHMKFQRAMILLIEKYHMYRLIILFCTF